MPNTLVATNALFTVNGIDLSPYITDITPNYGSEAQDNTAMGSTTRKNKGGLLTWSYDVSFFWDQSTGGPHATLWNLVGTTSCVEYRAVNACSTVSNPSFSGVALVENFPQTAKIGAMLTATATFSNAGTLSRASSS